jgi:hypothetical protein
MIQKKRRNATKSNLLKPVAFEVSSGIRVALFGYF